MACRDHLADPVVMANAAYALGCLCAPAARPALGPYAAVAVKCAVAAVRRHRADSTVVSNGLFAVGRLCEAAEPIRALVRGRAPVRSLSSGDAPVKA